MGVNLDIGGAITWVSESGSDENLINSHDWGRQIQMSFYSGPAPFEPEGERVHPNWRFLGWNPIQSGDCYGNESEVLAHQNDGESLYVKCIPMQWPMDGVPGECTFEVWIELEGPTAKVRSRLNNARPDTTQYPARSQELPAVYTNGPYYRLYTYTGDAPFTGGGLYRVEKIWDTSIPPAEVEGGPWEGWYATESWAALVNDDGWGIGVWSPETHRFTGGFAGKPGAGEPQDAPTGYFAPLRTEILDHDIQYEYEYTLILGSVDAIREYVYAHADPDARPAYVFERTRQSWTLREASDDGWPLEGAWHVRLTGARPELIGPDEVWDAAAAPVLNIRAAFETGADRLIVRWQRLGDNGPETGGTVDMAIIPDGKMRDYSIRLGEQPSYTGKAARLILQPETGGNNGHQARIERIWFSAGPVE